MEPDKRPAYEPAEKLLTRPQYDPEMKRPVSTVAGAVLVLLRVMAGVVWTIQFADRWEVTGGNVDPTLDGVALPSDVVQLGLLLIVVASGIVLLIDAVFAFLIYRGWNVPRVIVMIIAVFSITGSFVGWWAEGQEVTIQTSLFSVALDILILLALSSRSAAAFARRKERQAPLPA